MNTKESDSFLLEDFGKELKEAANCSDLEVAKFIEFLDKYDEFIPGSNS